MKTLTLATQKGGCGKTTLATNLAVEAGAHGLRVLLIDLDPQATAKEWWEGRTAELPKLVQIMPAELGQAIKLAQASCDLVIIDTPGRDALNTIDLFRRSDLVLIPCQPSKADIRAQKTTVFALDEAKRPAAFILTRCPPTGKRPIAARLGLESFGYPVLDGLITNRASYQDAYAAGLGVREYEPSGRASIEVAALWKDVYRRLRKHE